MDSIILFLVLENGTFEMQCGISALTDLLLMEKEAATVC